MVKIFVKKDSRKNIYERDTHWGAGGRGGSEKESERGGGVDRDRQTYPNV